jgi:GNAT superfamily N-acetyltransferase
MSGARTIVIRQMLAEDAAAVADLASQLGYPASESDIIRRFDLIKDRSDARLLVAQDADRAIVGWVHVQMTHLLESDPRAAIWGLVVAEAARGVGVGRCLLGAAEEWAVTLGLKLMIVNSNQLRVEARGFYEHLGYSVTKTQNQFRKVIFHN